MPLAELANFELTRNSLHRAAQLLHAVRLRYVEPMPNHLHHSLLVTPKGLTTGSLKIGGGMTSTGVTLDMTMGTVNGVPLNGYSLQTLAIEVLSRAGLDVPMTDLNNEIPFEVNLDVSAEYAITLYTIFTSMSRFKGQLYGAMTPIVVWSHHFDLSFLWFATPTYEESAPHMNFGFSPGDEGIPRPYFYSYLSPAPEDQTTTILPLPARWHSEGWKGARVDYDDVRNEAYPETVIETLLMQIFETVSPLLRK